MRDRRPVPPAGWVVALLGPWAVALALVPVRSDIRPSNVSLVLVLVVLGAAVLGGRLGGAVAAISSALAFDFLFTRPYTSFTIHGRDDVETTVLLLVVGLAVGELVVRSRRSRRIAADSRREVGHLRALAELGAGGDRPGELVMTVRGLLTELLDIERCRFERPPFSTRLPTLTHGRIEVPARETGDGFFPPGEVQLVVWGGGKPIGRFVLELRAGTTGLAIPEQARRASVALADQLGVLLGNASGS